MTKTITLKGKEYPIFFGIKLLAKHFKGKSVSNAILQLNEADIYKMNDLVYDAMADGAVKAQTANSIADFKANCAHGYPLECWDENFQEYLACIEVLVSFFGDNEGGDSEGK